MDQITIGEWLRESRLQFLRGGWVRTIAVSFGVAYGAYVLALAPLKFGPTPLAYALALAAPFVGTFLAAIVATVVKVVADEERKESGPDGALRAYMIFGGLFLVAVMLAVSTMVLIRS